MMEEGDRFLSPVEAEDIENIQIRYSPSTSSNLKNLNGAASPLLTHHEDSTHGKNSHSSLSLKGNNVLIYIRHGCRMQGNDAPMYLETLKKPTQPKNRPNATHAKHTQHT